MPIDALTRDLLAIAKFLVILDIIGLMAIWSVGDSE